MFKMWVTVSPPRSPAEATPLDIGAAQRAAHLFWPGLRLQGGAVLLASRPAPARRRADSLGALEAASSLTHILDVVRHRVPFDRHPDPALAAQYHAPDWSHPEFRQAWELAKLVGQMWMQKLRLDFPEAHFRVYCTRLDDPVVRFHRVRAGERHWATDDEAAPYVARGDAVIYDSSKLSGPG